MNVEQDPALITRAIIDANLYMRCSLAGSLAHGGHAWTLRDVESPARLRLYRATAVEQFLGVNDRRVPVTL